MFGTISRLNIHGVYSWCILMVYIHGVYPVISHHDAKAGYNRKTHLAAPTPSTLLMIFQNTKTISSTLPPYFSILIPLAAVATSPSMPLLSIHPRAHPQAHPRAIATTSHLIRGQPREGRSEDPGHKYQGCRLVRRGQRF